MSRRGRRATSPLGVLALLVFGAILALIAGLSQLLSSSPVLASVGLILVVIGAIALFVWLGGRRRLRANTLAELLAVTPTGFEQAVADLLQDLGYREVRRMGGAGDLNVDIWCRDKEGKRVAVQCKRYAPAHRVGSPEVQTFIGMIFQHHGADQGMFVTTSSFTTHALRLANEHRISPVDGARLSTLILDAQTHARTQSSARPPLLRAPVLATALPLGLLLLGGAGMSAQPPSTPISYGALRVTPAPEVSSPTLAPTRITTAAATPTLVSRLIVGNTAEEGVYLRRTPVVSDRMKAYADGVELRVIGPDVDAGGVHWRHVVAPDGAQGYVPADYVIDGR